MTNVYIVEYPKCGRTWVKAFLKRVIHKTGNSKIKLYTDHDGMTLFGRSKNYNRSKNLDYLPPNNKAIFLARNPYDVMVSFYYYAKYNRGALSDGVTIDKFVKSKFGIEQMLRFYQDWSQIIQEGGDGFLFMRYEQLKNDDRGNFKKILNFIPIKPSHEVINDALDYTSLEKMKNRERSRKSLEMEESYKIRSGKVGDYVNHLPSESIKFINNEIEKYDNFIINYYKE